MSSVQVLPLANYPNGTHVLGPVDFADDVTSVDISIARCTTANPTIWPNASTVVVVSPEVSLDGGSTWGGAGGFTSNGGIFVSAKTGLEVPTTIGGGGIPAGSDRKYRCTVVITGGPLRSSATVEVN